VEIMIVIVIIGLLAGVVTVNVRSYMTKAKQNTAKNEIATIVQALDTFYASYGRYPSNEEGLTVLTEATEKDPEPLLSGDPIDPWGQPYQYNSPGSAGPFEVICYGADGRQSGTGAEADITSDQLKDKAKR
jgi:general secretion pathway protein G